MRYKGKSDSVSPVRNMRKPPYKEEARGLDPDTFYANETLQLDESIDKRYQNAEVQQ